MILVETVKVAGRFELPFESIGCDSILLLDLGRPTGAWLPAIESVAQHPLLIALSMLSLGTFPALASWIAERSRGWLSGSPPPRRAATVTSRSSRVKSLPRRASMTAFLCLIPCHLLCPAIVCSRRRIAEVGPAPRFYSLGVAPRDAVRSAPAEDTGGTGLGAICRRPRRAAVPGRRLD